MALKIAATKLTLLERKRLIGEKKAGRKSAEEILMVLDVPASPIASVAFWERLREIVLEKAPLPKLPEEVIPYTQDEAKKFGKEIIPFGKHEGRFIDEIPLTYLCWLADVSRSFSAKLVRYLRSDRIQYELKD